MKKQGMAQLVIVALALGTASCMSENPVERPAADSGIKPAVAARVRIGSTEGVTDISTLAQLRAMQPQGNYRLTRDIEAAATANAPFVPIGSIKNPFHGTFDGGIYKISNLTIKGGDNTGMFSWAANADLKNIHLVEVRVTGGRYTGAIAGRVQNSDLKDSYVTGIVSGTAQGESMVGMFFGSASAFTRIYRCYATGTVKGWAKYIGGAVGHAYAVGTPNPNDDFRVTIDEVFTNVNVDPNIPASGAVYAGGLVGYLVSGQIGNINTVGPVRGRTAAGGIVGHIINEGIANILPTNLYHAMSRGVVTDAATPLRAGTVGTSTGAFGKCATFWDMTTDTGELNPNMSDLVCQRGMIRDSLKLAQTATAPKNVFPYITGTFVTQERIDNEGYEQCKLGSGSDGDWGFGSCPGDPVIWAANSPTEYNTLTRIPNPEVQPKL